jgi:hypothetical protein
MRTCFRCPNRIAYMGSRYCGDCGGWAVREALEASARMIEVRCVPVRTFVHSDTPVPEAGTFGSRHRHRARTYVSLRAWTAEDHARALQYAPKGCATDAFVAMLAAAFPNGSARWAVSHIVGWWDSAPESRNHPPSTCEAFDGGGS